MKKRGESRTPGQNRATLNKGNGAFPRRRVAALLAVVGGLIGAVLCSAGYICTILVLEAAFVPPLQPLRNAGQFGMLLVVLGCFGFFFGLSFGILPYSGFVLWIPFFVLITACVFRGDVRSEFNPREVTFAAMLIIGTVIIFLAFLTALGVRRLPCDIDSDEF